MYGWVLFYMPYCDGKYVDIDVQQHSLGQALGLLLVSQESPAKSNNRI